MSPRTGFSVFYNTVLLWGERRHPHPKLVPGDVGKVGREGRKNERTKWPYHFSKSLNASLVGVPSWLSVKLSGAGRACSSWGSRRAASLASPVH